MQDNDDTWREERRQFEEYRMKEANVNQRKRTDLEKQIHDSKERMEEYRLRQEEIALEDWNVTYIYFGVQKKFL